MLHCTYQEFVLQEYNSLFDIHVRLFVVFQNKKTKIINFNFPN